HELTGERAIFGRGIDTRLCRTGIKDVRVGISEMVARPGYSLAHSVPRAEVVCELVALDRFLELQVLKVVLRHNVVVDVHREVAPRGLAVEQAVRLDRGLLRLAFALDRDSALEAPFRRPAVRPLAPWVLEENVLEYLLETFVGLKLGLDLGEDFVCWWPRKSRWLSRDCRKFPGWYRQW